MTDATATPNRTERLATIAIGSGVTSGVCLALADRFAGGEVTARPPLELAHDVLLCAALTALPGFAALTATNTRRSVPVAAAGSCAAMLGFAAWIEPLHALGSTWLAGFGLVVVLRRIFPLAPPPSSEPWSDVP